MEQDGCFVIWRDVRGYIYHIRRARDCLAISILCAYIPKVPRKHTSVSLETSSCHSVCTHYVATSTMLNLLWLCNVTNYLPIYLTANSVSALKDSIYIFECELTCVYQRAQGRAPSTSFVLQESQFRNFTLILVFLQQQLIYKLKHGTIKWEKVFRITKQA